MFERNFLILTLLAIYSSIAFSYVFSFNFFESLIFSSLALFTPFILTYFLAQKNGIFFELNFWNYGILISFIFAILKIPIFPFLSVGEIYYKKFKRISKPSVKEIRSYFVLFCFFLLILMFFGIFIDKKISVFSSIFLLSFLLPYKNSVGSKVFFYDALIYGLFLLLSFIFSILSIFLL